LCIAYGEYAFARGLDLPKNCDAVMYHPEETFYVEYDSGKNPYQRVQARMEKAYGPDDAVLFVTATETRLRGVMEACKGVWCRMWFATLTEAIQKPDGHIWRDLHGDMFSIG
jgi:hypothetical protein